MAWIAKPSGTAKIERRDEPYLTASMRERFERELLPRYETRQGALLPILHEIQHAWGHIPHQAMLEIAAFLGLRPADVLDTVTFYEEFTTRPRGECVIGVCQSIACEVCGHQELLDRIRQKLGIEPGETTDDGKFTLITMECLGSCDTAPVALVNETLHEGLTAERLEQIVDEAARSERAPHGPC
ncbi:MAG TPA: NADH-quinone oxidoreductase subunit NuoE [Phycisphaerales bacterium]|nr:NADH-quinone oxidoreductase subunit NuoE [Phycisphaerales bacterium]HMP36825.1 NADH-quinone oxidoreductase subunit NuoE [Phycisphaerales bacterium]